MINHSESNTTMNNKPALTVFHSIFDSVFGSIRNSWPQVLGAALMIGGSLGLVHPGVAAELPASANLPDGTYLFGEAPGREQQGSGYVVFTQAAGRVIGAIYQPNSDYQCFSGVQENQQLYITAYSLGDEPWRTRISLPQMYEIRQMNEMSRKALSSCRQEMVQLEQNTPVTARQYAPPQPEPLLPAPTQK
jgi:hypothetical protein